MVRGANPLAVQVLTIFWISDRWIDRSAMFSSTGSRCLLRMLSRRYAVVVLWLVLVAIQSLTKSANLIWAAFVSIQVPRLFAERIDASKSWASFLVRKFLADCRPSDCKYLTW